MRDAATLFMSIGFVLAVIGLGMLSVPAALVIAGVTLFISGGLEHRAQQRKSNR